MNLTYPEHVLWAQDGHMPVMLIRKLCPERLDPLPKATWLPIQN